MPKDDALVVFTPSGRRGHFPKGTPILQAARELGVDIDSVCGGRGLCGRCQVVPSFGSFAKHGVDSLEENIIPLTESEQKYDKRKGLPQGRRLSCFTHIQGDIVVDVPADSQIHQQVVCKALGEHEVHKDPAMRLYVVQVEEPTLDTPLSDMERLDVALQQEWQLQDLHYDLAVIQSLQPILRQGEWQITIAVYNNREVVAVWPGYHEDIYGLAVDIGTTTVAAHLSNLITGEILASAGEMNPQIRFGEDLMSRVSYCMMNEGGEREMTREVRKALNRLATKLAKDAEIDIHNILEITAVGNPIMHHLLLGINPVELGGAPFPLANGTAMRLRAAEIDLKLNTGARVYLLPCIAGHVGADTAGAILSEKPYESDKMTLLIDVGTNAEIVLGNKDRLLAASSPTGPAFEGAQISSGQRAAAGAIERVRIDPETRLARFKVIGCDAWSDAPEFAEQVKSTGVTGICGSGIIEVIAEMYVTGIISQDGIVNGALASQCPNIVEDGRTYAYILHQGEVEIRITQNDVRAIQLAKAALYAGVRLLMDHAQIQSVDQIFLAGAFGSQIDVKYAMLLGLIPDCDLSNVGAVGNAAGTGAWISLLNQEARQEIETVVQKIEKIETATEVKFQEYFVSAMAIPNDVDAFPHLEEVFNMPARTAKQQSGGGRRRQRSRGAKKGSAA